MILRIYGQNSPRAYLSVPKPKKNSYKATCRAHLFSNICLTSGQTILLTQSMTCHVLFLLPFNFFFFFIFSEEGLKVPDIFFFSSPSPTPLALCHLLLQEIHTAFSSPLVFPPGRGKGERGRKNFLYCLFS